MNRRLLIKFSAVLFITLLILIPLSMIKSKISERAQLRAEAEHSVAASWTGTQTVSGPVIAIDYEELEVVQGLDANGFQVEQQKRVIHNTLFVAAVQTNINALMGTNTLKRGIYPVTVYTSTLGFTGYFDANDVIEAEKKLRARDQVTYVEAPRLIWHFSDPRGLNKVSSIKLNEQSHRLLPGTLNNSGEQGLHLPLNSEDLQANQQLSFALSVELRGMHSLNFLPSGKQTELSLEADWPHPKFVGAFLPSERTVSNTQFSASWHVNEYASASNGVRVCGNAACGHDYAKSFGVELVDPIDVYLQSERAVKYGFLFVSMIFVGFVVFEMLRKLPIHPVQYTLVGVAIALFFLLLISLSEHLDFGLAYGVATIASVAIIGLYLRAILLGWLNAGVFSAILAGLYTLLFVIIQSEDYALLMGTLLCFMVLATVMMVTRKIDWYEVGQS